MIEHDKQWLLRQGRRCFFSTPSRKKQNNKKSPYETEAGVHMKGGDGAVSKQKPWFYEGFFKIMLEWTRGRLNAGKAPSWTLSSNYPPHPPLSSFFSLLSADFPFFLSIASDCCYKAGGLVWFWSRRRLRSMYACVSLQGVCIESKIE